VSSATHHIFAVWYMRPDGSRENEHIERLHRSRTCDNCPHDGLRNTDWLAEGGVEQFGRCMNLCSAADAHNPANRWCSGHQTVTEFRRQPAAPALDLVTEAAVEAP